MENNTDKLYHPGDIELKIDPDFRDFWRQLSPSEYQELFNDIKTNGCLETISTWNNYIADGHNRHKMCCQENIPFRTKELNLQTKEEVLEWLSKKQNARRNVSDYDRCLAALKLEDFYKTKAKENQRLSEGRGQKGCQISDNLNKIDTKKELAKIAGVSHDTIRMVKKIQEANPDKNIQEKLSSNEMSINAAYTEIFGKQKKGTTQGKASQSSLTTLTDSDKSEVKGSETPSKLTPENKKLEKLKDMKPSSAPVEKSSKPEEQNSLPEQHLEPKPALPIIPPIDPNLDQKTDNTKEEKLELNTSTFNPNAIYNEEEIAEYIIENNLNFSLINSLYLKKMKDKELPVTSDHSDIKLEERPQELQEVDNNKTDTKPAITTNDKKKLAELYNKGSKYLEDDKYSNSPKFCHKKCKYSNSPKFCHKKYK